MTNVAGSSVRERMLIEQKAMSEAKCVGVAYLLWLLGGSLGAHRFYIGRTGSAFTLMGLFILGWATLPYGVGLILLIVVGSWLLLDRRRLLERSSKLGDALSQATVEKLQSLANLFGLGCRQLAEQVLLDAAPNLANKRLSLDAGGGQDEGSFPVIRFKRHTLDKALCSQPVRRL
ncbi:NINE protein [Aurantimonas coralicida]|nr:NINE protein [Aurantimonas coralicida]